MRNSKNIKSGTVLMYNCSGPEFSKLRQIFAMLRMRMHPITPDRYNVTLGELVNGEGQGVPEAEAPAAFDERILVFCNVGRALLNQTLEVIRLSKLPEIQLKAVLTETNQSWNSIELHNELMQERAAIAEQLKAKEAEKAAQAAEKPQE